MTQTDKQYDVALSFAGEDRTCAEALAGALKDRSVSVFYDKYEKAALWGKDLYAYLSDLYQNQAQYCVMFLSKHYAAKLWTNHERKSAQARAFQENNEYILPIRLDNTEIPGLPVTTGYLDWNQETVNSIADAIIAKLGKGSNLAEFQFYYGFEPEPGLRKWYQLDEVRWVEQYPSGHTTTFVVVDRTTIRKTNGMIVRKAKGNPAKTLVPDYGMEVFIPDRDNEILWLMMRHSYEGQWGGWRSFAEITYTR